MKKTVLVLALLFLNLASHASDNAGDKKKKIACTAAALLIPLAAFAGPEALKAAAAAWATACVKPKGSASSVAVFKKDW